MAAGGPDTKTGRVTTSVAVAAMALFAFVGVGCGVTLGEGAAGTEADAVETEDTKPDETTTTEPEETTTTEPEETTTTSTFTPPPLYPDGPGTTGSDGDTGTTADLGFDELVDELIGEGFTEEQAACTAEQVIAGEFTKEEIDQANTDMSNGNLTSDNPRSQELIDIFMDCLLGG